MKQTETMKRACQVLRSKINLRNASVRLASTEFPKDDTEEIREALKLYLDSWVHPIIDAIEAGDMRTLRYLIDGERMEKMIDQDTQPKGA